MLKRKSKIHMPTYMGLFKVTLAHCISTATKFSEKIDDPYM
jgi:hypothetical protein